MPLLEPSQPWSQSRNLCHRLVVGFPFLLSSSPVSKIFRLEPLRETVSFQFGLDISAREKLRDDYQEKLDMKKLHRLASNNIDQMD